MQTVKCMILLSYFIACHGQTIHLSITTNMGCLGGNVRGPHCSLFDKSGNEVDYCLMKDCLASPDQFTQHRIQQCQYGLGRSDCMPIILEFEIPKSKQKVVGKCPDSKITFQLESRVFSFWEGEIYPQTPSWMPLPTPILKGPIQILPVHVEIDSSSKITLNAPYNNWCPIAPTANGLALGPSKLCELEGEKIFQNVITPLNPGELLVESVKLQFLDEKTKSVIPMPAKKCASSTLSKTGSSTAAAQTSKDKLLELLLIQMMLQNSGSVSRGAYPSVYNLIPGYAPSFPYSFGGYPSAFSGNVRSGLPSITSIKRKP